MIFRCQEARCFSRLEGGTRNTASPSRERFRNPEPKETAQVTRCNLLLSKAITSYITAQSSCIFSPAGGWSQIPCHKAILPTSSTQPSHSVPVHPINTSTLPSHTSLKPLQAFHLPDMFTDAIMSHSASEESHLDSPHKYNYYFTSYKAAFVSQWCMHTVLGDKTSLSCGTTDR